jgi:Family of unknown function (DUF695)/Regulator of ribonuclease activity B
MNINTAFLIALLGLAFNCPAQTDSIPAENWDTYMAKFEKNKAGSVLVNLALKKVSPMEAYPFLVVTGVKYTDCPDKGFPSKREYNNLYAISDSVKAEMEKISPAILCGTFTFQCQRLDYFYVADTSRARLHLQSLYRNRFPAYEYYINIKADKAWLSYNDFLYPNDKILDFMGNQKILMALQRAGDKLTRYRPIDHSSSFKTEADRTCFISYAIKKGFRITKKDDKGEAGGPFRVIITKTDRPAVSTISKITLELRQQAAKCNGEYESWETVVIR